MYRKKYPENDPSRSIKGVLYKKSDCGITFKKPIEACPNNLAPTSSTTCALALGDALAVTLLTKRGFTKSDFHLHFSDHVNGNNKPSSQPFRTERLWTISFLNPSY